MKKLNKENKCGNRQLGLSVFCHNIRHDEDRIKNEGCEDDLHNSLCGFYGNTWMGGKGWAFVNILEWWKIGRMEKWNDGRLE